MARSSAGGIDERLLNHAAVARLRLRRGDVAHVSGADEGEDGRADRGEFSHVRSADNGGAWCACNLLPESGAVNAARGRANVADLTPGARALLAAWPAWWRANVARKASLARLGA